VTTASLPPELRADAGTLWEFTQLHHQPRPVDLAVGLGSHDLGVATRTAELYHRGLFPTVVFTGANAPTTAGVFPRGEAVHYREHALGLGVPPSAILVEPAATHTGENITLTRALVERAGLAVRSVMLICRPYQQRRAYATCRHRWPGVEVVCASRETGLDGYIAGIGDAARVVTMLVGDTQRVWRHAERGWAEPQPVPGEVRDAYHRLVAAGFTGRLVRD
jgi:uncharacterized SAM-binding protein YcdF (DUF218 family)